MEQLASYPLGRWYFDDFKYVSDLIEYEGPILVHYRNNDRHALFYWVDNDEKHNRWLCFEITVFQLYDYLNQNLSLHELMVKCSEKSFFTIDIDTNLKYTNPLLLAWYAIPESYIPDRNSYYTPDVPKEYEALFESLSKDDYTEFVRRRGYDLMIKPNRFNRKNKDLLTIEKMGSFLLNVDESYDAFSAYYFIEKNKDKIRDLERLLRTTRKFVKSNKPLAADNKHGSFSVSLTAPIVSDAADVPKEYIELREEILKEFKTQVLDIDLDNDEVVEGVIDKFDVDFRKKIFGPIIKIINDTDYNFTVINKRENTIRDYKKIRAYNEKKIVPDKVKQEEVVSEAKKIFLTITLEVEENRDLRTLSKKDFEQATLFSTIGTAASHEFDALENENYKAIFANPISLTFERVGENMRISFAPLKIIAEHPDKDIAFNTFLNRFFEILVKDYLAKKPANLENWEYMTSIVYNVEDKTQETPF